MFAGVAALTLGCSRWGYEALDVQADGSRASGGQAGAPGATEGADSTSLVSGTDGSMSGDGGSSGETSSTSSTAATGSEGQPSTSSGDSAGATVTTDSTTTGQGGASTTGQTPEGCVAATFMSGSYAVCDQAITYEEAQTLCEGVGMRVVRIDSAEENVWVASQVTNPWLGANSLVANDEWRWEDGELFWVGYSSGTAQNGLFTSWGPLNPASSPVDGDCAQLQTSSLNWVDLFCSSSRPTVCESY